MRHPITLALLLILSIATSITTNAQTQETSDIDFERIQRATVYIIQVGGENLNAFCVGTGTIVRYDGLILTNAHNVVTSEVCQGTELIIAMTINPDEPPVPKYRASIIEVDQGLDLALLQITQEEDGRLIEPDELPILPFVSFADSTNVNLDDTITIVGYPSIGNESIRLLTGTITGFIAEKSGGDKSWVKMQTLEPVSGIMSGGGAYNQQGELIGVPTSAPISNREGINCRYLDDTNNDGFINRNDSCIPIGDVISVIRPSDFARPLLRSASLGLTLDFINIPPSEIITNQLPSIDTAYFAVSTINNLPTRVVNRAPAGITSLYFFFNYNNFTNQTVYEVRVSINGSPAPTFSLPPVRWSGLNNGTWYMGISNQPFPNGSYEFQLLVNGTLATSRTIEIGGDITTQPSFSNMAFGYLDDNGTLSGESYVLPVSDTVSSRFIFSNMTAGTPWTAIWYYNDTQIIRIDDVWEEQDGQSGLRSDVSIAPTNGMEPGIYRLDLGIGENPILVATGEFIVAGTPVGVLPQVFNNIRFIRAESANQLDDVTPSNAYPDGADNLFIRFDWQNIVAGTSYTIQLLVDDTIFYEEDLIWNAQLTGEDYTLRLSTPTELPDATYTINLAMNGILLESGSATVGIGQLSIDRLAQPGGIQLRGQIVDGDTGQGIPHASFVLISEDFSVADFEWRQEQIYALAITDSNGRFEIDRLLQFDSPYSIFIVADGYYPVTQDGYEISAELLAEAGGSPVDISVSLIRD